MTDESANSNNKPKKLSVLKKIKHSLITLLRAEDTLEQSITDLINKHDTEGNPISDEEKQMIQKVIRYGKLVTSDIMIPRVDIAALPETAKIDDFKRMITLNNFTRLPIYHDTLDNVVGFVNLKDLLPLIFTDTQFSMETIMREILVVSPTMKLIDLLVKMKQTRVHIAVVVDDYGGTDGLITFEDLVEEIVGNVEDEFDDTETHEIIKIKPNVYISDGRTALNDLTKKTGIVFSDEVIELCDTIGGYVLHLAGHVPKKGEIIKEHNQLEFEIIDSNPRTVKKLLIRFNK